jgi:CheY-like chemotaxis protein
LLSFMVAPWVGDGDRPSVLSKGCRWNTGGWRHGRRSTAVGGSVTRMGKRPLLRDNRPTVKTVLVVDDHAGFRARARMLLEADGYDVVGEASDGDSALTESRRLGPDIVLLDVQLPDLDGFEVAERITGESAAAVVLTSSRDWSDSGELIERSGARGFVPKDQLSGRAIAEITG